MLNSGFTIEGFSQQTDLCQIARPQPQHAPVAAVRHISFHQEGSSLAVATKWQPFSPLKSNQPRFGLERDWTQLPRVAADSKDSLYERF